MIPTKINKIAITGVKDRTAKKPLSTPSTNKPAIHCPIAVAFI
jgi:hypothetical protein